MAGVVGRGIFGEGSVDGGEDVFQTRIWLEGLFRRGRLRSTDATPPVSRAAALPKDPAETSPDISSEERAVVLVGILDERTRLDERPGEELQVHCRVVLLVLACRGRPGSSAPRTSPASWPRSARSPWETAQWARAKALLVLRRVALRAEPSESSSAIARWASAWPCLRRGRSITMNSVRPWASPKAVLMAFCFFLPDTNALRPGAPLAGGGPAPRYLRSARSL